MKPNQKTVVCQHGRIKGKKTIELKDTGDSPMFIERCVCCDNDFLHGGYTTFRCFRCENKQLRGNWMTNKTHPDYFGSDGDPDHHHPAYRFDPKSDMTIVESALCAMEIGRAS